MSYRHQFFLQKEPIKECINDDGHPSNQDMPMMADSSSFKFSFCYPYLYGTSILKKVNRNKLSLLFFVGFITIPYFFKLQQLAELNVNIPNTIMLESPISSDKLSIYNTCTMRNISNYKFLQTLTDHEKSFGGIDDVKQNQRKGKDIVGFLRFTCSYNETECDNFMATNYDGPNPPCCSHILRDSAREFDRVMCYLGLEYFPAFGMLLGLTRKDRLIPWTIDNDYVMTREQLAAAFELWPKAAHLNHGLTLAYSNFWRVGISSTFAQGRLLKWEKPNNHGYYFYESLYSDIFPFVSVGTTAVQDILKCTHPIDDMWPIKRKAIYNGTVMQYFPNNEVAILERIYGPNWVTPDANKSKHGNTNCHLNSF